MAQPFKIVKKGYDPKEVDVRCKELEAEIIRLQDLLSKAGTAISKMKKDMDSTVNRYSKINKELQMREETVEEISRLALKEANQIIEKAQRNADIIVRQATLVARDLLMEVQKAANETEEIREEILDRIKFLQQLVEGLQFPNI